MYRPEEEDRGLYLGGRPGDHSSWPPVPTPRADFPHGADDTCIREFSTDCKQCGAWAYQQP